jgi:uncharacterized DUF497 family protein
MKFDWDEAKAAANLAKHRVAFKGVLDFDWDGAVFEVDSRRNYGEPRMVATSTINGRLHILVFTQRGYTVRVISLRKANGREVIEYDKVKKAKS